MDVKLWDVSKITPYARNPRKNDAAVSKVASSIKEFGFQQPIVVDKDNVVIVGHTRLKAAIQLGMVEVPVLVADKLNPQQAKAYRIADNKTIEYSSFDYELLTLELEELQNSDYDVSLTGFEDKDLIKMLNFSAGKDTDPNEVPIVDEDNTIAKPGQLYQLDKHRILCGDSTDPESYKTLLGDELAQMVWTDPPYNVNYTSKIIHTDIQGHKFISRIESTSIKNDSMDDESFYQFLYNTFTNIYTYVEEGAPFYICHASHSAMQFLTALQDANMDVKQHLIWIKNHATISRQDYNWNHEPILYGWKPGAAHKWYGGFQTSTTFDDRKPIKDMKKDELVELAEKLLEIINVDTFDVDRQHKNDLHPTMKPIELIEPMIVNSSRRDDIVLEPFSGSGGTIIASENQSRRCYAIELEPKYVDVSIKRWENYTGKSAKLK